MNIKINSFYNYYITLLIIIDFWDKYNDILSQIMILFGKVNEGIILTYNISIKTLRYTKTLIYKIFNIRADMQKN